MPSRPRTGHQNSSSSSSTGTNCLQPSILVVDDDPDILTALVDLFEHAGYGVTAVSTCAGALSHIEARQFAGMLLDVGLPDGDGIALLDRIQVIAPSLPVIILTAVMTPAVTAGALARGAFACLGKPYDQHALLALLRRATGMQSELPPADY